MPIKQQQQQMQCSYFSQGAEHHCHCLSSTQPPPKPPAKALGEPPQFTAIRYTQNPNLYNLIQFNSYFIQLLYNTGPTHTTQHPLLHHCPPTKPPPISWLSVATLLHLTGAFTAVLEINWRGMVQKTLHVESSRTLSVCRRDYSTLAATAISAAHT